jgi:hypothetical protein
MTPNSCGCCSRDVSLTPVTVTNRPGLSAIAYRIGTYSRFRETMLDAIAATPELTSLSTRESGDYSITLIELWAALLDVVTFYQERNANEFFLQTARQFTSLRRLAKLLDYSPRTGVAAVADLVFTLDPRKTVTIPIGLRVQSVPGQNQQPQIFETIETAAADARFNQLRIYPPPANRTPLQHGFPSQILDRLGGPKFLGGLSVNDTIVLFNDKGADAPEEKKIASLNVHDDSVTLWWTQPVQGTDWDGNTLAYKFRRTFRFFGFNAPAVFMQSSPSTAVPGGILWSQQKTDFTSSGGATLNLDSRYADLATGTQLMIAFQPAADPATVQTNLVLVTQVS